MSEFSSSASKNASVKCGLRLVPARPEDALALRDRAVESFRDDYATYGAKPPGIEEEDFHARAIEGGHYHKILHQEELVGAILLEPQEADSAEIALFYVIPSHQNLGIGADVLAQIEGKYPDIAVWRLVTPSAEPRNRHFYESHGYVRTGTTTPQGPGPTVIRYEKRAA